MTERFPFGPSTRPEPPLFPHKQPSLRIGPQQSRARSGESGPLTARTDPESSKGEGKGGSCPLAQPPFHRSAATHARKHPHRPIHGLILRRDPDHPNLASLFAKRIPKPPMRGSPQAGALLNCPNGVYNAARCRQ